MRTVRVDARVEQVLHLGADRSPVDVGALTQEERPRVRADHRQPAQAVEVGAGGRVGQETVHQRRELAVVAVEVLVGVRLVVALGPFVGVEVVDAGPRVVEVEPAEV